MYIYILGISICEYIYYNTVQIVHKGFYVKLRNRTTDIKKKT